MKMMEHFEDHVEISRKSVQDDESIMKMMKEYEVINMHENALKKMKIMENDNTL